MFLINLTVENTLERNWRHYQVELSEGGNAVWGIAMSGWRGKSSWHVALSVVSSYVSCPILFLIHANLAIVVATVKWDDSGRQVVPGAAPITNN